MDFLPVDCDVRHLWGGGGLGPLSGSELVSSLVKTDSNWLLSMLALLKLSLFKNPSSFFRGDTPADS